MISRLKKLLCLMLCGALVLSSVPIAHAAQAQDEKSYDIYPVVREISYDGTQFVLDDQVNVVYETGIDDATKAYLSEVLEENGISAAIVDEPVDGESNILLGVNGSGESVDAYEDTLTLNTENLYEAYDAYVLEARDGQITIVGRDTDAVYRGVATLKMMLSSFEDDVLLGAQIEDYAGIEFRGFIEGFYGGWDYETRAELMKFARDVKMNMYVYASKTDAYHTNRWADLYPESDIRQIEELVKIGQQTKCYYVWSVHLGSFFSGLNISTNPSLYEQRYQQLVAKLTQLYDVGVRKFDILNDDFGSGSHADVVTVLNRLTQEFIIPKGCDPITYCPQGYNKAWSGNGAELDALKALDDSIILYWTGDDVNSPITQSTVDYVADRTGQPVSFWLNYPVNEHARSGIFLGNITHYARDCVTGLKAAVSNPSRFGQSNKVALFQLASLFWNNTDYSAHAEDVWHDSFNYLEEGVEDVYRTIARNVANCPGSSRVGAGFPESEYIKDNLDAVAAAVNNGEPIAALEDTKILQEEFANILSAIEVFRRDCANADLVSELDPWLKSLEGVTTAGLSALNAIVALETNDTAAVWTNFAAASKALQTWNAYLTCDDPSITNKALAGSKRLQPFAAAMLAYVDSSLTPLFDANYAGQNLYAVLGGQKQVLDENAQRMFDGDLNTYAQWDVIQQKDDYFGVDLGAVRTVTDISIVQGNSDTHHDYFHKAVLEYSEDGKTFAQLGDQYNDTYRITLEDLDIQARYVRLRLVETGTASKPDYWTHVREFTVNKAKPEGDRVYTNVETYAKQPLTIEGKEYSLRDLDVQLDAGEYIGIKLANLSLVSAIGAEGTGLEGLRFEYSSNGGQWNAADAMAGSAVVKYVRLYNDTDSAVTFDLGKLGVTVESAKADPKFLETNLTNGLKEGSWTNVFDGDESTYAWTNEGQSTGDYITFDLGANIALHDVTVVTADGNPRLYNAEIQISADKSAWQTIATVVNDNSEFVVPYRYVRANADGADARYLRIYFTGSTGYYLKLHEILLNTTVEDSSETEVITATFGSGIEKAIDGNLTTLFSGTATAADSIEYKFTEATNFKAISILQDPTGVSNATVWLLKDEGWAELGKLDESAKKFVLDSTEGVYGLKLTFESETDISIYEIYLDSDKTAIDDIGEYVDPIIITTKDDLTEPVNLAPGKEVTVSGTSDGNKDNVNDGDTSTKWDSDFIKGSNAKDNSWIYIDLGAEQTSIFDEMTMHYFNKIYPTIMSIQISNDAQNWTNVSDLTSSHNGPTHPVVTEEFETPYAARYVRLFFEELNSAAAGNGVGVTEWEITGIALSGVALKSVSQLEDITKELNEELTIAEFPDFLNVVLTQEIAGDIEVTVPVSWDLSAYDASQSGVYEVVGTLDLPASVRTADNTVTVNVVIPSASEDASRDIPVSVLTATAGDEEQSGGANEGPARLVLDNNTATLWHTDWYGTSRANHWIQFELSETYAVDGLRYQPRQTANLNGTITEYDIQVSNDGENFRSVAYGNWDGDSSWKIAQFAAENVKYVRLVAVDAMTDNNYVFASAAEIRLTGVKTDAPPHEHSYTAVVTEPTCTEGGYTTYTCSCGDSYVADETAPLGHTSGEPVRENEVAATCTEDGSYDLVTYCTVCGEEVSRETVTVAALGHTEEIIPGKDATCTEPGLTEGKKCSVCGEILVAQEEIAALGHTEEIIPAVEPTCTEPGLTEGKKCSVCGEILVAQEEIPALGHDWKGTGCSRCDATRENPFTDVPEDSFYIDPVLWAVEEGITNGATETTFNPNGNCMRAHVVTFLWRAAGSPEPTSTNNPFVDVKETDFFYKAVLWAVENEITNGLTATTFGPTVDCNRAQVVTFLWRAMNKPAPAATEHPFTDVVEGQFYYDAMLWAVENGITNGLTETTFGPNALCNRAQVVTFLYRTYVK